MKLLRYGPAGAERPGLLDDSGNIRDLSGILDDISIKTLQPAGLQALKAIDSALLPIIDNSVRLGTPWTGMRNIVAIGLNYHDHAKEAKLPLPSEPIMFTKWHSSIVGPNDGISIPPGCSKVDWEVELAIVIGQQARRVNEEDALKYVAGYTLANDVSERSYQMERSGGQWSKGKGFDTFGPLGPYLTTCDEIADPQQLELWLDVNGERMQAGHTSNMIFSCAQIVSYCSQVMTLDAGDVILTGTPHGVGMGFNPPRYLNAGDVVTLGGTGLGVQRQEVSAAR
ncbi:fumarylacetoacetate hydrolase family protein [Parapusillimonas sp. JC17]|uniref:fumarylacetoacetate hydrolase family protein n=1 Tax=Parapusillimonas sp. JC17 TaxID=3445768 RepID=UPI003F9F9FE2